MTYDPIKYATDKKYRESVKKAQRKFYQKNRETRIEKQKKYNLENGDAIREYMRNYMPTWIKKRKKH